MIAIREHQYFLQLSDALGYISAPHPVPARNPGRGAGAFFSAGCPAGQRRRRISGSFAEFATFSPLPSYRDGQKLLLPGR